MAKSIMLVIALSVAVQWGALGIAYGHLLTNYSVLLTLVLFAFVGTPVSARLFIAAIWPSMVSSLLMGVALYSYSSMIPVQNGVYALFASIPIAITVYVCVWILLPGGNVRVKEFVADCVSAFRKQEGL